MSTETETKPASSRSAGPSFSPGTGLLIDFADEENVPFPQQLMTGAEVDDTYGIYECKKRSASVPVISCSSTSSDVFSPIRVNDECDSVFKVPDPLIQITPVKKGSWERNKAKSRSKHVNKTVGVDQIIAASSSMLGLNEGFNVTSTSSSNLGTFGEQNTLISDTSSISTGRNNSSVFNKGHTEGSFVSPISTESESPKGIMDASNDSQLLDIQNLSSFSISDSETPATENKKAKLGSVEDILDVVFKRQSLRKKPTNEAIAKKVQEMFDAASPSKNPHLFTTSNPSTYRTYTPQRAVVPREAFSYGTPKRQALFSAAETEISSFMAPTPTPIRPISASLTGHSPPVPVMIETPLDQSISSVRPIDSNQTPASNPSAPESRPSVRCNLNLSRLHSPQATGRLSFSSTSSSSGCETGNSVKLKTATIKQMPIAQPKIQCKSKPVMGCGVSKSRFPEPKPAQPLKAIHHIVPPSKPDAQSGLVKLGGFGCVSAPVHRKFAPPIAASSPKVNTSFSSCDSGASPRKTRTSIIRSSGYGQQIPSRSLASPKTKELNTSISRIPPPSPNRLQLHGGIKSLPSPILKPVTAGNVSDDQKPSGSSVNSKRRSVSYGGMPSHIGKTGKAPPSLQDSQRVAAVGPSKNTKENKLRVPQKFGFRKL